MTVAAEAEMAAVPMTNEDTTTTRDLREDMDTSGEVRESGESPLSLEYGLQENRVDAQGIFLGADEAVRQYLL
jgi:hypothetical protein